MVASNTPGTVKAPGLPNITGNGPRVDYYVTSSASGCLYITQVGGNRRSSSADTGNMPRYDFDASRSNDIYGASDTVQPPAVTVRFIIKY